MQFKQLQDDMIAAMKARDKVRKDAISTLVSAAKKVAIDEGCRDDISGRTCGPGHFKGDQVREGTDRYLPGIQRRSACRI